ncbi:MAG: SHD1 domain-containing protein, partial [Planctomycetota bacterium]
GEPAADATPVDDSAPADAPAADPFARGEPERRWIDATGTASMVATLIEVAADGRCVLETRGRRVAVPVKNLSGHDRDYVRQAGVRLAKLRADKASETAAAAVPAPIDTAGL